MDLYDHGELPLSSAAKTKDSNEQKSETTADFECNVCFEVAKDPVVTCCGHLFCWPCLYRWLHVHCKNYKECPVCKGKVNESSIVPIYGRESSEGNKEKEEKKKSEELKVPPRPQGNRVESLRQWQQITSLRRAAQLRLMHLLLEDRSRIGELRRRLSRLEQYLVVRRLSSRSDESAGIASADDQGTDGAHASNALAETSSDGRTGRTTGEIQRNTNADASDGPNRRASSAASSTTMSPIGGEPGA